MPWPAVEVAKLAVGDAHIGCVRVAVNDPGDGIARYMVLTHRVADVHQFGGGGIFKEKNAFFGREPFEAKGALEEIGCVHISYAGTLFRQLGSSRNSVPAYIFWKTKK